MSKLMSKNPNQLYIYTNMHQQVTLPISQIEIINPALRLRRSEGKIKDTN